MLGDLLRNIISVPSNKSDETDETAAFDKVINFGDKALEKYDYDKAIGYFDKAKDINNEIPDCYKKLADAYCGKMIHSSRDHDKRVEAYIKGLSNINEAIKLARNNEEKISFLRRKCSFYKWSIIIFGETKGSEYIKNEAIECSSELINLVADDYELFLQRANFYLEIEDYQNAYKDLMKISSLNIGDEQDDLFEEPYKNCTEGLIETGLYKEASNLCILFFNIIKEIKGIHMLYKPWDYINEKLAGEGYAIGLDAINDYLEKRNQSEIEDARSDDDDDNTETSESADNSSGVFGGITNLVKKGVNAYKGSIEKEIERMEDWSEKRLIWESQNKSVLPSGMAATRLLKEKYGYSNADIANKR